MSLVTPVFHVSKCQVSLCNNHFVLVYIILSILRNYWCQFSDAIQTQQKARNAPRGCLKLCLYGITSLWRNIPMISIHQWEQSLVGADVNRMLTSGNWEEIREELSVSNVLQRDNVLFASRLHSCLEDVAAANEKEVKSKYVFRKIEIVTFFYFLSRLKMTSSGRGAQGRTWSTSCSLRYSCDKVKSWPAIR